MFKNCRLRLKITKDSHEIEASGVVALLIVVGAIAYIAERFVG